MLATQYQPVSRERSHEPRARRAGIREPRRNPLAAGTTGRLVCETRRMTALVLVCAGGFLAAYGCLRGYAAARGALLPLVREGDPTRSLIDASRPVHARTRVRVMARHVVLAIAWLALAMYGLFLATAGFEAMR